MDSSKYSNIRETPGFDDTQSSCDQLTLHDMHAKVKASMELDKCQSEGEDEIKATNHVPGGALMGCSDPNKGEGPRKESSLILNESVSLGKMLDWMFEGRLGSNAELQALLLIADVEHTKYRHSRAIGHINKAIDCWETVLDRLPNPPAQRRSLLSHLSLGYRSRFIRLEKLSYLSRAIEYGVQVASLTPDDDPEMASTLTSLMQLYSARFELLGELLDVNNAAEYGIRAVSLIPDSHPHKPGTLCDLGRLYESRFKYLGEQSDISQAVEYRLKAVSLVPDDHPDRPFILVNLVRSYLNRLDCSGELSDLNNAIKYGQLAVELTPDGHPHGPQALNNLMVSYRMRSERSGDISDLNSAVEWGERVIALTPDDHPAKLASLSNLGSTYRNRFSRQGNLLDLNLAIECGTQAALLTPDDHPDKPGTLTNLGLSYTSRFDCLGELLDLQKGIEYGTAALSLIPDDNPEKPTMLNNLGYSYIVRFERLGEFSDLNKSIECGIQAASLTPSNHPRKARTLSNLESSYSARFDHLGDISDLNKAVEYGVQATSLTPDGHVEKSERLGNLGGAYLVRFQRLRDPKDLENAVKCETQALELTPDDVPRKQVNFTNLGNTYLVRFQCFGELSDLNKAVEYGAQAVSLTPDGDPGKPGRLNNLGNSYRVLFGHLGEVSDLNKAIECVTKAVLLTPDVHPDKPTRLSNLGALHNLRFGCLGEHSDIKSAEASFSTAARSPVGSPSVRFEACREWIKLPSFEFLAPPHQAYQQAIALLPLLVWIGNTLGRRYELVAEIGDIVSEAASYAISINAHDLALEWLEAGRSIVWRQTARLRTPFDELSTKNPELAGKLVEVGQRLEHAGSRSPSLVALKSGSIDLDQEARIHERLAMDWDILLDEARSIPGFEDFLREPNLNQILQVAKSHPIAVINVHKSRCDALILRPNYNAVAHVPLPGFSVENANAARKQLDFLVGQRGFVKAGSSSSESSRGELLQASLKTLWFGVAMPVLDFLGYKERRPIDQLPRVTWCTTGLLSFLPLHAAGCYDQLGLKTFDYVVSSYTPTLSALAAHLSTSFDPQHGVVSVGQEHTIGFSSLPFVNDELSVIRKLVRTGLQLELKEDRATVDRVLDEMERFGWVHMACHGTQDPADPMQSAFHLHDGDLTLAMISKRSYTNKGLAFLSACQTATGDKNLPDEAVHLAAGMLMAGYPSVIGTMWSIADEDGPEVAERVYMELLKDRKMDHTNAAVALHHAAAQLREKVGDKAIARWAPFVHIGV